MAARTVGTVAALYRFPVKSMLGERLDRVSTGERGFAGDRAYAVVDRSDGRVASAKHPRKWGRLLEVTARYVDEPGTGGEIVPVELTLPDGTTVRSDAPGVDGVLSRFCGREVALASGSREGEAFEEVWPAIDGLAPEELVAAMSAGRTEDGQPVSDIPVASMAPAGTYFDLATLHVITTATLRRLAELEPSADFDHRRYRPNVLVDVDGAAFVENAWVASPLAVGDGLRARVDLPTMRCVMTTLAQDDLPADRRTLQAIARHNRVEITGIGRWACAGVYATITHGGDVAVGDPVALYSDSE